MERLEFKGGLLYTSVSITLWDKKVEINDVIIDTGASHTIIFIDYLDTLDAEFSDSDTLVKTSGFGGAEGHAIRKSVTQVQLGDIKIENFKVDFGDIDPYERVNGLIGLDFLMANGLVVDLEKLCIYSKNK